MNQVNLPWMYIKPGEVLLNNLDLEYRYEESNYPTPSLSPKMQGVVDRILIDISIKRFNGGNKGAVNAPQPAG